jgi:virginiamycin B lyase
MPLQRTSKRIMSKKQQFLQPQLKGNEVTSVQTAPIVTEDHRGLSARVIRSRTWLLLGMALLGIITLLVLSNETLSGSGKVPARQVSPIPALADRGLFREYPLPLRGNEVMRPAVDHRGRIWFGAMGENALVIFDPRTLTFQYLAPPGGHHGIMGVLVAPDDTIWFAEQYANYLGHYFPTTGSYQIYLLPWISIPDPGHAGQKLSLPSAPNELALDAHGDVWFTEFNADRLGHLDPRTGRMNHYPLSSKKSVQSLYPYGVTVDSLGNVWFTESGSNQLGRLDAGTGALHLFTVPDAHALTMEIASDGQGSIWVTSFTPGLLFRFEPGTRTFTTYTVSLSGNERGTLYGLLATKSGVWVTILAENMIAHLDVATGRFMYYRIPASGTLPLGLAMDANQNLWFTGDDKIGKLHPARQD